ncbi:hypothetical protein [Phaeodactylibacter xiamenensis]|uniref:hypothetical protein n=1 Tax=Phaeodactylibacter xiamenensis TaxID=1524460 RepID=UPI0024A963E6|nr:hypothetical protein [Phaeodactylibacter xiamenensis]
MKLMPQEEIASSALRGLTITNKRIRYINESAQTCWSLYLNDIVSVSLKYQSRRYYLSLALFCAVLSAVSYLELNILEIALIFILLSGLFVFLYWQSQSSLFTVTTVSTSHSIAVSGASLSTALVVIELIEHNKGKAILN